MALSGTIWQPQFGANVRLGPHWAKHASYVTSAAECSCKLLAETWWFSMSCVAWYVHFPSILLLALGLNFSQEYCIFREPTEHLKN